MAKLTEEIRDWYFIIVIARCVNEWILELFQISVNLCMTFYHHSDKHPIIFYNGLYFLDVARFILCTWYNTLFKYD